VPSWHVQKWLAYILFSSLVHFYVEHVKILASNVESIFPNQPLYGTKSSVIPQQQHLDLLSSSSPYICHLVVSNFHFDLFQ
jgi:hypothetical protein